MRRLEWLLSELTAGFCRLFDVTPEQLEKRRRPRSTPSRPDEFVA